MAGKIQNTGHYELPNFYWGERGAGQESKRYDTIEEVPSLCGAAVLYRKDVFRDAGLFDEDFIMYGEDTDMSLRLKQRGYKLIFVPLSVAYHKFHGTGSEELSRYYIERNRLLFLAKHYPNKLSSSLLGSGYFTVKKSLGSLGSLYSLIPEIVLKLVKTQPAGIAKETLSELFAEAKRINNLENDLLAKKCNEISDERDKANAELTQVNKELKDTFGEIGDRDARIDGLTAQVSLIQQEKQGYLDVLQGYLDALQEKEKELTAYKKTFTGFLSDIRDVADNILCSHMKEIGLQDGQLIGQDVVIAQLKNDFKAITDKFRQRMNEVLLKEGEIIERRTEIDTLREELTRLAEESAKNSVIMHDREQELVAYKEELSNLSSQLRFRMDQVLIKDGQLIEKDVEISRLGEEMISKDRRMQEEMISKDRRMQEEIDIRDKWAKDLRDELNGIYDSDGFRYILRPLWALLLNARALFNAIKRKVSQVLWLAVSFILTPVYLFLSLLFLLEYASSIILSPLLKIITPKRKVAPVKDSKISMVIPNYNGVAYLKECLPSVFSAEGFTDGQNEVLVVDDGSKDGSVDFIRNNFPKVRIIQNKRNRGFGFTCNRGIKAAENEVIVLINNDIILTKDFLKPLLYHLEKEDVFAVTPKLYGWDRETFVWGMHMGHFDDGYIRLWNEADTRNGDRIKQASPSIFAIGGAMVFRKRDFIWLGGFDPIYRPNCWEDIDISYRALKRGLKVVYEPSSLMYHKGRATLTYERHKEIKNELLFTWKNITSGKLLKSHLNLLPRNLYKNKMAFLKGLFWALNHIPDALLERIWERGFVTEPEDQKIFNKIMLYYENFLKRGFRHRRAEKPNILLISRFAPYPLNMGGRIRMHNLVKLLSEKYNFILLSLIDHESELNNIPELKKIFSEVYLVHTKSELKTDFITKMLYPKKYKFALSYSQELIDKLKEIQESVAFDLVHIESNELLYLVDHVKYAPLVYTEHDISILNPGKSYYKQNGYIIPSPFDYLRRFHFHASKISKIDKVITLSKEDEEVLRAFFPKSDITLVPTGVNLEHFSFRNNTEKSRKLIFVGHYRHYPNEDAIVYFAKKIFPLIRKKAPDVKLLIVGSNPTANVENLSRIKNVVLVGGVADVKPYLDEADVFVNSIRISAGIKGKVLEAMACGVPVVSTEAGSSGIDAKPGEEILIADNPRKFANQVIRLLSNEGLRHTLINNARHLAEDKYDWYKCVNKLDAVYKDLLFASEYEALRPFRTEEIINKIKGFVEQKIEQTNGNLTNYNKGPEELHIELTYNCNSKCIMCDLWDYNKRHRCPDKQELSLDEIKRFVEEARLLQKTKIVVLSGGEPFLRNDLVDICGFFTKQLPDTSIRILTNGVNTETIVAKTREVFDKFQPKSLWLGSSLDGIGKEHDRIRGSQGAFAALCKTINQCKKELPQVRFSATFTLTPYNIGQLIPVKQFASNEGLDFFAQFVVPKEAREEFVWTPQNLNLAEKEIMQVIQEMVDKSDQQALLDSIDKVQDKSLISQIYYWAGLIKYQTNPQRYFKNCVSGAKFAMFNPYGDLFFCPNHKGSFIGNIRKERFDDLWFSEKAQHLRDFIKDGNCHCWLICIVSPILEKALNN
ncbi:MAG: glycosyltransferase [Candidatus Omnitrophica bacterium]|nr:glycosyltransferase [Candidatus Omnitrophota bacterium]